MSCQPEKAFQNCKSRSDDDKDDDDKYILARVQVCPPSPYQTIELESSDLSLLLVYFYCSFSEKFALKLGQIELVSHFSVLWNVPISFSIGFVFSFSIGKSTMFLWRYNKIWIYRNRDKNKLYCSKACDSFIEHIRKQITYKFCKRWEVDSEIL